MKIRYLVLMAIAIVILLQSSGLKSEECRQSVSHLSASEVVRGDAEAYPNVQKP